MTPLEPGPDQGAKLGAAVALCLPDAEVTGPSQPLRLATGGPQCPRMAERLDERPYGDHDVARRPAVQQCPNGLASGKNRRHRAHHQ